MWLTNISCIAASCAATQELPNVLCNPKVHCHVHKNPPTNFLYYEKSKYFKFLYLIKMRICPCSCGNLFHQEDVEMRQRNWIRMLLSPSWICSGLFIFVGRKLNTHVSSQLPICYFTFTKGLPKNYDVICFRTIYFLPSNKLVHPSCCYYRL
jgi:hypothetical protein